MSGDRHATRTARSPAFYLFTVTCLAFYGYMLPFYGYMFGSLRTSPAKYSLVRPVRLFLGFLSGCRKKSYDKLLKQRCRAFRVKWPAKLSADSDSFLNLATLHATRTDIVSSAFTLNLVCKLWLQTYGWCFSTLCSPPWAYRRDDSPLCKQQVKIPNRYSKWMSPVILPMSFFF